MNTCTPGLRGQENGCAHPSVAVVLVDVESWKKIIDADFYLNLKLQRQSLKHCSQKVTCRIMMFFCLFTFGVNTLN